MAQTDTYAITTNLKMLASTVQFSTNTRTPTALSAPTTQHTVRGIRAGRAPPNQPTHHQTGCRLPQDPTGCLHATTSRTGHCFPHEPPGPPYSQPQPLPAMTFASVSAIEHPTTSNAPRGPLAPLRVQALLRKEVIQPHLPVRLPCYDFVPIASPTFDGSLPQGVGPPASGVADFRDVTGGVYKARERIHRSVADLRLLATPTSRGRVADPDPN